MSDVKFKDREDSTEYLRLALVLAGINTDYQTTDLIQRLFKGVEELGGGFSLKDEIQIQKDWAHYWQSYDKDQEV